MNVTVTVGHTAIMHLLKHTQRKRERGAHTHKRKTQICRKTMFFCEFFFLQRIPLLVAFCVIVVAVVVFAVTCISHINLFDRFGLLLCTYSGERRKFSGTFISLLCFFCFSYVGLLLFSYNSLIIVRQSKAKHCKAKHFIRATLLHVQFFVCYKSCCIY